MWYLSFGMNLLVFKNPSLAALNPCTSKMVGRSLEGSPRSMYAKSCFDVFGLTRFTDENPLVYRSILYKKADELKLSGSYSD